VTERGEERGLPKERDSRGAVQESSIIKFSQNGTTPPNWRRWKRRDLRRWRECESLGGGIIDTEGPATARQLTEGGRLAFLKSQGEWGAR